MASSAYVQSEATLVASTLSPTQKVYPEFCNEIWNGVSGGLTPTINSFMTAAGEAAFPTGASCPSSQGGPFNSDFSYQFAYGIQQQVVYADLFYATLGSSRVVRILAGQDSYFARNVYELSLAGEQLRG